MGLSSGSKTTTQVNTPSPQQVAAGQVLTNAYNQQAPRIQGFADQIGSLVPSLMDSYRQGDAGVNSARDWITRTLSDNGPNPYLDQIIAQTGTDTANGLNAGLGTRGLTGGSVQQSILAKALAQNAANLRYNDYNAQFQRQQSAASLAPSISAADTVSIAPLLSATSFAANAPLAAASQYASGQGGLFGGTGTTTTKQPTNGLLGGVLGSVLGSVASGLAGGIKF